MLLSNYKMALVLIYRHYSITYTAEVRNFSTHGSMHHAALSSHIVI